MQVIDILTVKLTAIRGSAIMRRITVFLLFVLLAITVVGGSETDDVEVESDSPEGGDDESTNVDVDEEKLHYARGSVCGYCSYCKFCKLCDKDCPCETSHSKPNCRMCKYCKYCYLCSALCDTVCSPGGILDRVSGAIVNALPSFNKIEVDDDINSVKHWIDKKKDEL